MKAVTVTAICIFEGIKDSLTFDVELDSREFINTRQRLTVNGFADGHATWNNDHYSICLFVYDKDKNLAGITWDDRDTMTADILNRRIVVGEYFHLTSAHGTFRYEITTITAIPAQQMTQLPGDR